MPGGGRPAPRPAAAGAVVATLVLLAACGAGDATGSSGGGGEAADGARRIEVTAGSYSYDPEVIRVAEGEEVAIVLRSTDIVHDFTIDELDAHVLAKGGERGEGGVTAGRRGRYTFYCSLAGHRSAGMEGTLVVG